MLTAFFILSAILTAFYIYQILGYIKAWQETKEVCVNDIENQKSSVSILVAARNEEENIKACLNSIEAQNFPKEQVEIIVLDDFSDDDTLEIVSSFSGVKCISLKTHLDQKFKNHPNKKRAISLGVSYAKFDLIVCADADCIYPKNWLKAKTQAYQRSKAKLITSPVIFINKNNIFSHFLSLDLISLMGITAASIKQGVPSMANGANMMFEKAAFNKVNGYQGNEDIPSGDDVFLMQKINKEYPRSIKFLKNVEAIALTAAPSTFKAFIQQRIRWTSKSKNHAQTKVRNKLILNVLFYLCLCIGLFVVPFVKVVFLKWYLLLFSLKMIVDYMFFKRLTKFFNQEKLMLYFLPIEIMHLFYISVLGFLSLGAKYTWKGRQV